MGNIICNELKGDFLCLDSNIYSNLDSLNKYQTIYTEPNLELTNYEFQIGDIIEYEDTFNNNNNNLKNQSYGPKNKEKGIIIKIFPQPNIYGVIFQRKLKGGNDLGFLDHKYSKQGFWINKSNLKLIQERKPPNIKHFFIKFLFEKILKNEKPMIILLQELKEWLFQSKELFSIFIESFKIFKKKQQKEKEKTILFIASIGSTYLLKEHKKIQNINEELLIQILNQTSNYLSIIKQLKPKFENKLISRLERSQINLKFEKKKIHNLIILNQLFKEYIYFESPTKGIEKEKWNEKIENDKQLIRIEKNILLFQKYLSKFSLKIPNNNNKTNLNDFFYKKYYTKEEMKQIAKWCHLNWIERNQTNYWESTNNNTENYINNSYEINFENENENILPKTINPKELNQIETENILSNKAQEKRLSMKRNSIINNGKNDSSKKRKNNKYFNNLRKDQGKNNMEIEMEFEINKENENDFNNYINNEDLKFAFNTFQYQFGKVEKKSSLSLIQVENEYEKVFLSDVITPEMINVKFSDIGNLHQTKITLSELVILPFSRPELFQRGNLVKHCTGILLFGPPGNGKTMLAKAVATESKANFLNIHISKISSKWFGEGEKYAKAVFTLARKLAPCIIFIDEVDSMLNARNKTNEHEASRKIKNTFMEHWEGLLRSENERITVIGATNRPYDLDTAVLRRFPIRLYVGLPNLESREKILRVILKYEDLEKNFDFHKLAIETQGYSGNDLQTLCRAASYRPVREFLQKEALEKNNKKNNQSKNNKSNNDIDNNLLNMELNNIKPKKENIFGIDENDLDFFNLITKRNKKEKKEPNLRYLKLNDFIESKKEVGKSVSENSNEGQRLKKWNQEYGQGTSTNTSTNFYYM
ncbi:putative aaa atpase [Anaeramoeba flamelloides]|uniref:Aaa atpase n=1 Tax=Anaeramoeba flamelloides TaxID=1746091 RepID=A0AAV7YT80_9EUKA|nr:putative aaa atpase [Anaeramoeba flamelloides]